MELKRCADHFRHVEYCTINAGKHGLVSRVRDWPHSSFHRDVRAGEALADNLAASGKPALYLHRGPGLGFWPGQRRLFDPDAHPVVFFDQRGAGRRSPARRMPT
jgi:pimeloyl-ACP methyl ester carboxylesterase